MRSAPTDAGFTLIELLVSMALLGMAAVLVAQGFSTDRRLLQTVQGRASAGEDVAAAQDLIRDRIEHLFPQAQFDSAGPHVDLTGSAGDLEFLTFARRSGRPAQIERQKLTLSEKGDLSLAAQNDTDSGARGGATGPVLHRVRNLELGYYGSSRDAARPTWRPDWVKQSTLPQLIRVRLNFEPGDRRVWPELIVRPAATVDTACILDVETAQCRGRQ